MHYCSGLIYHAACLNLSAIWSIETFMHPDVFKMFLAEETGCLYPITESLFGFILKLYTILWFSMLVLFVLYNITAA